MQPPHLTAAAFYVPYLFYSIIDCEKGRFMSDTQVETVPAQLMLHGDEDTPREFIVDLLRRVFGKSESEAASVMADIEKHATAACGPYPPSVAGALLESARRRITSAGHPLLI